MIAEIYPLKRLPRRFGVFDYAVPETIVVERGSIVAIPFRASETWGVVARVKDDVSERPLKPIAGVHETLSLSDAELSYIESVAGDLAQSPSAVLHLALPMIPRRSTKPRPQKRTASPAPLTLQKTDADALGMTVKFLRDHPEGFASVPDLRLAAAVIQGCLRGHSLASVVVCPNVRDATLLADRLGAPYLLTGDESQADRRNTWMRWRMSEDLLVGTRLASLLPHPKTKAIFVVRSSHANLKQEDRNPRFDARAAARLRAQAQGATLTFLDVAPRPDELDAETIDAFDAPETTIVNLSKEASMGSHPVLTPTFAAQAEATLAAGKRVLCVYNYKGVSKSEPRGIGNQEVLQALKDAFPTARVALLDREHPERDPEATLWLTTNFFLENTFDPFSPIAFGLVADLHADFPLRQPHFRAAERAAISALEWRGVAHASKADFLIQTDVTDLFERLFKDPLAFMRDKAKTRLEYGFPPARRHIRIGLHVAALPAEHQTALQAIVHDKAPGARCEPKNGHIEISIAPDGAVPLLAALQTLDDRYIVDTWADS